MATIYFKKLFEVRILHEYYLSKAGDSEFFALSDQEKNDMLEHRLFNKQYDIGKYLTIEPTMESSKILQGQHIRFVPQPTGFLLGIEVKPENNQFFPLISLEEKVKFAFLVKVKDPYFRNYTNLRLKSNIPGVFYFTNANTEGNKNFPALSVPVAPFQTNKFYEMGELAVISGNLKEAVERTKSTHSSKWRKLDSGGLAHEGDRILLPQQFFYEFDKEKDVRQATFTLKTLDGVVVRKIVLTKSEKIDKAFLDFRLDEAAEPQEIPYGLYDLEVSGNNGYQDNRRVYLHNEWYNPAFLGVINISNEKTSQDFSLLNPTGDLKDPPPIFEIRLKSRITYWRYRSDTGKLFKPTTKTDPYLKKDNGNLRTIKPRSLTFIPHDFVSDDPAIIERVFLPNPSDSTIRQEADGRIYSDIYVSKIRDLIAEDV